ncbi:flippase-like domain-containing protein [Maribacter algarum]|uniref:Flippase-like domain-containing protein n=1 Tax=Maribacter algarum (ex Zhang et al. 2020) TaxID=2578118 RepID=A0A5S3PWN9_9FLAO|nr:lysylphosphatidylglycerol synthase transmembrane domain-containing protein [Maribacter algarum]TMM59270.1 flippase-like domain-containing protein [Maribacter algarum]
MSNSAKKALKILLPILLGVFLLWYLYYSTTSDQRSMIWNYIKDANPYWVSLSVLIGVSSHVSRAIRWNYLLEPLGYTPSILNNSMMIFTTYLSNLGIPRSGEFLRPTELATYENVPFEIGFGTIVTERIVDVIMLLLIIFISVLFQADLILGFLNEAGFGIYAGLGILIAGVVGLVISIQVIKKSSHPFAEKIKTFLNNMLAGITSIFKMKRKGAFLFHTLYIWFAYIAMFYVIKYTVPEMTEVDLGPMLLAFVGGAIAMTTTNGGFLAYPIFVGTALQVYGINFEAAQGFGWIMWIAQTLMVVVFGAISFLLLPLLNRNR